MKQLFIPSIQLYPFYLILHMNCAIEIQFIIHSSIIIYLSINSISQSIDDTAQELLTNRHVHNSAGSLDNVAFLDQLVVTEHDNTDIVRLQVQRHALEKRGAVTTTFIYT